MQPHIRRIDPTAEFATAERCFINELPNQAIDPAVSIARARVEPGTTTCWHRLSGITERYVILSGRGRVEVGNLPVQEVAAGDVVLIPPDCPQRIQALGDEMLVFLAICTPRFELAAYQDLEPAADGRKPASGNPGPESAVE